MDSALEQANNIMVDVSTEATRMSSDTVGADERLAISKDIQFMIDDIFQKANTKFGGQYIFGGHKIFTQPYQVIDDGGADDGKIDYFGDQELVEQRIELNGSMVVNIPGSDIFGTKDSGIFKILADLKIALENNDVEGIQDSLPLIAKEMDRITAVRGEVGVKIKRVEASIDELSTIEPQLVNDLTQIEDTNITMEAGIYMATQEAYQATLEATGSTLRLPKLIDFLR
jgi:flagellar hook-associated protein 3 FlgL